MNESHSCGFRDFHMTVLLESRVTTESVPHETSLAADFTAHNNT